MGVGGVYAAPSRSPLRRAGAGRGGRGVDGRVDRRGFFRDLRDARGEPERAPRGARYIRRTGSSGPLSELDPPPSRRSRSPLPAPSDLIDPWSRVERELRSAVPEAAYRIYLEPLQPLELSDGVLRLSAPASKHRWVIDRFGRVLQACAAAVLGPEIEVDVVEATSAAGRRSDEQRARPSAACRELELNPKYTFDQFVIGNGNRLAHAAALAVAELPAQAYNPLFVYGAPGVGKTHLLGAIGNYTVLNDTSLGVRYATAETFTGDFTGALRAGEMRAFKNDYRLADVLLLDDVQFFESKSRTGEELFHTFESLLATGAQVVLAADRPPSAMPALDPRLRDRFEAGLLVDLHAPDFETRLSIIRKRAGRHFSTNDQLGALELLA